MSKKLVDIINPNCEKYKKLIKPFLGSSCLYTLNVNKIKFKEKSKKSKLPIFTISFQIGFYNFAKRFFARQEKFIFSVEIRVYESTQRGCTLAASYCKKSTFKKGSHYLPTTCTYQIYFYYASNIFLAF